MFGSYQRTLKNRVSCIGTGLHSGAKVSMSLVPAAEDTGITFFRRDEKEKNQVVEASYKNVSNTMLGTTLTNEEGVSVATVEHLMAALWACGVDNCVVELDGPEVPIMDGSSEPFIFLIECAGIREQSKTRRVIEVLKEVRVEENGNYASIRPAEDFSVSLEIDFNDNVIANQKYTFAAKDFSFKTELSRARTFCFRHEVDALQSRGLARGGSLDNAIVVDTDGIMNEGGLRYNNEFVRHKVLDYIGDVYLAGGYIRGGLDGFRTGHGLNNKLLREFFADEDAWRISHLPEEKLYATA